MIKHNPATPLCSHVETLSARTISGTSHVFINSIDPAADHTCEVCRKLLSWDALLAACHHALGIVNVLVATSDEPGRHECVRVLRAAITKADSEVKA